MRWFSRPPLAWDGSWISLVLSKVEHQSALLERDPALVHFGILISNQECDDSRSLPRAA